ncbi:MAG: SDR family NAD(P)-dependent oxidoreductase [Alphaproteobacteria bacterium]|nr:SDR family NAD(P)-dependent oxidoreductase [Alphaproteobacteria bacterium]
MSWLLIAGGPDRRAVRSGGVGPGEGPPLARCRRGREPRSDGSCDEPPPPGATLSSVTGSPPTCLVTGASTGLGLAITRLLLDNGYPVVATARPRSMDRFAEQGLVEDPGRLWLRPLDVTELVHRERLVDEIEHELGGLGVLINNAGVSYRAVVEHVSPQDRIAQMNVNFQSPMSLARLALPGMRARCWGRIIHVSSVGGMMAMPTMCVYSASKFALEGASEALWYEVRPWGIGVSLVQPGFINSDGYQNTFDTPQAARALSDPRDPYHAHYTHMGGFIGQLMKRTWATPESVARKVLWTIRHPDPPLRVPATFDASLFGWMRRLLPRGVYHRLLYAMLPGVGAWGPASEMPALEEGESGEVKAG